MRRGVRRADHLPSDRVVCLPGLSVSVVFSGISALRCAELEYEKEQHKLRARSLQVSEYRAQARVCVRRSSRRLCMCLLTFTSLLVELLSYQQQSLAANALLIEYDLPLLPTYLLTDSLQRKVQLMGGGLTHSPTYSLTYYSSSEYGYQEQSLVAILANRV